MSETQIRELFARHADSAEPPLPARFVAQSVDAGRRRLRRRRATRAAAVGVAAVAAVAIGATAIVGGNDGVTTGDPGRETVAAAPTDAVALLGRISLAAGQRRVDIRDDQFIYQKHQFVTKIAKLANGKDEVAGISESWRSVDGTRPGLMIFPDKLGQTATVEVPVITKPSLMEPTYRYLSTLPTDPDALLALVGEIIDARPDQPGNVIDRNQESFEVIGIVLGGLLPPDLGAALYRAAAKIPGVTVIPDVTDTAGRSGIAVSRRSTVGPGQATWIFDRQTYEYRGASVNRTKIPGDDSTSAVLVRGVVDRVRETL